MNIGFYVRDGLGKSLKREHRAFYHFLAWVGDLDTKDDNDKTKIVPYLDDRGKINYKVMLSASDMGGTLGTGHPNFYNYPLVKKVYRSEDRLTEIRYNYFRIYPHNIFKAVSFNDIKWIVRRIAQLSVPQIEKAFFSAGYPEVVAKYYAKMMAQRTNQLIRLFEMEGEVFEDDGGKIFKLSYLPIWNEKESDFSHLFKQGILVDDENTLFNPKVENWPRNWGVGFQRLSTEPKQKKVIAALKQNIIEAVLSVLHASIYDAQVGIGGLRLFNVRLFDDDHPLKKVCGNDCFLEAMDVGLKNFIPMRYIVQNPETTSKYPYLLVDLFRFGFFLGENGKLIQKALGFELPSKFNLAVGSQYFKSYEFIKIKPVEKLEDYYKKKLAFIKLPKYALTKMRSQLVGQMQAEESLIVSSYVGLRSHLRLRHRFLPFASAEVAFRRFNIGRSILVKNNQGKIFANWVKGKFFDSMINLNAFDWGLRLPLLSIQTKKNFISEDTYIFDSFNPTEMEDLKRNMTLRKPRNLDAKYLFYQRSQYHKEKRRLRSLVKILGKRKFKRKIINKFKNLKHPEINFTNKIVEIEHQKVKMIDIVEAGESYKSTVYMNDQDEVIMGVNLKVVHPAMKKWEFKKILKVYQSILPSDLIPFNLKYMKQLLGKTTLDLNIQFGSRGLLKFFDPTLNKDQLCLKYASFKKSSVAKICPSSSQSGRSFERFWKKYRRARRKFLILSKEGFSRKQFKRMNQLGRYLFDHKFKLDLVSFLMKEVGEQNYLREVVFESARYPIPGDIDILHESNFERGRLEKLNFFDEIQTEVSKINDVASRYYYDRIRPFFREDGFLFNVPD